MGSIPQVSVLKGLTTYPFGPTKLHSLLERSASDPKTAKLTALIYRDCNGEDNNWSYRDLDSCANQLARAIVNLARGSSVANGDGDLIVGVALTPSDHLVLTLLSLWKAGAAYLPLDTCSPQDRINHIIQESKPMLIITEVGDTNGLYRSVNTISFAKLYKEASTLSSAGISSEELLAVNSHPTAIVMYTSGSTGVPKGVRLSHAAVLNRLQWQWREFPYGPEEHICAFKTALTFVDSVSEIWGPLLCPEPKSVLVVPREITKDPQRLIDVLEQYKIERLVLVPTLLRNILMYLNMSNDPNKLQRLRLWVCSGETLTVSLANEFIDYFNTGYHTLCNFYGSTEIMGDVSYHIIRSSQDINFDGKVPIGVPVDNTILYLLDKDLRIVPSGETGELFVAGRNLASGYVKGRDADRFIDNPHAVDPEYNYLYKTGDYAKIVKNTLIYEGRTDSQVKIRGHRVDLAEIETALGKIKGIEKAVVLCYKPGEINQAILAFIIVEDNIDMCDSDIELRLTTSLPPYAIPQVITIEKIPLLINGKVDRQYLLRSYEELYSNEKQIEFDIDYTGIPSNKLIAAECLFNTIASVLGASVRGKISTTANFYSLGGNSLNSVFTVTKLRDQGFFINITDFITAKSLGEVLGKMVHENDGHMSSNANTSNLKAEMVREKHKADLYRIITDSFYEKADLERWIEPPLERNDYTELLDKMWDALVAKNLSFVVKSESGEIIGVSLNFDAHDEPEIEIASRLTIVFNFLEYLEGPIRERKLPQGKGKVLHSFMMGTDKKLTPGENVEVIEFMEKENLKLARSRSFAGIFTTNTNPLTQQLGTDIFHYTVMHNYQVNQYVAANGTRPFKKAPDNQKAVCSWKLI